MQQAAVTFSLMTAYGAGMVDAKMAVALTGRTGQRLEDYKKLPSGTEITR